MAAPSAPQPGRLHVITASGVGQKGTLINSLRQKHPPDRLRCRATTREPRSGERDWEPLFLPEAPPSKALVAEAGVAWSGPNSRAISMHPAPAVEITWRPASRCCWKSSCRGPSGAAHFPRDCQLLIKPPLLPNWSGRIRARGNRDSAAAIERRLRRAP